MSSCDWSSDLCSSDLIGQVGIGRNNLLKPVRRASCKRILCNYPGVWRARNCDGKCVRRPLKKRTADIAAAVEKIEIGRASCREVGNISEDTESHEKSEKYIILQT